MKKISRAKKLKLKACYCGAACRVAWGSSQPNEPRSINLDPGTYCKCDQRHYSLKGEVK